MGPGDLSNITSWNSTLPVNHSCFLRAFETSTVGIIFRAVFLFQINFVLCSFDIIFTFQKILLKISFKNTSVVTALNLPPLSYSFNYKIRYTDIESNCLSALRFKRDRTESGNPFNPSQAIPKRIY